MGGKIVAMAMKYIGSPYVWAGASPKGFDCSGFVMYVVQQAAGLNITHSIGTQASSGQYVSKDNLQPGDLIYFAGTYTAGLSHAGIYIGGGRFIHAENESTGVVISNLTDWLLRPEVLHRAPHRLKHPHLCTAPVSREADAVFSLRNWFHGVFGFPNLIRRKAHRVAGDDHQDYRSAKTTRLALCIMPCVIVEHFVLRNVSGKY